jgi:hypothetical protein
LALCCAGALEPEGEMGVLPPDVVPEGEEPPSPPAEPEPEPEPDPPAWPGLRFSVAVAARAVKADIVLLPVAGLSYISFT